MTHYTNIKMRISEGQKEKNKKAFESNGKYIAIRFKCSDQYGTDVSALTKSQVDELMEEREEKRGRTIRMSKTQLAHNAKIEGGFLPAIAGLIPFLTGTLLPALGVGALSGLASWGVQKLIANWVYLKKRDSMCRIETDVKGLYLGPVSGKEFENVGNGLYLMKQGGLYDDRGLSLGLNSPFKNIPILDMIL